MKNYDELTNDLLKRRDCYVADQKKKRKRVMGVTTSLCCLSLVALLGLGMWQGGMFDTKPSITMDDSINIGEKDYIEPDELDNNTVADQSAVNQDEPIYTQGDDGSDKTNDFCDMLGMVIIDNVTYIQFISDTESYTADVCLGFAGDFEGTYKTYLTDISGELYTVKENNDVLLVKLENGGVVTLIKEKE